MEPDGDGASMCPVVHINYCKCEVNPRSDLKAVQYQWIPFRNIVAALRQDPCHFSNKQ
jgi:hypothetical protein